MRNHLALELRQRRALDLLQVRRSTRARQLLLHLHPDRQLRIRLLQLFQLFDVFLLLRLDGEVRRREYFARRLGLQFVHALLVAAVLRIHAPKVVANLRLLVGRVGTFSFQSARPCEVVDRKYLLFRLPLAQYCRAKLVAGRRILRICLQKFRQPFFHLRPVFLCRR